MSGKLFVNYRRGDDPGYTQALYLRLEAKFTAPKVFMDVEGHIKPGDDFVEVINAHVAAADAMLVVIGPRWTELLAARAADAVDYVVAEIEAALVQKKRVIPVLVGGAGMPRADLLPKSIMALSRRHASELRPERFNADCQGLLTALRECFAVTKVELARRSNADAVAIAAGRKGKEADQAAAGSRRSAKAAATRLVSNETGIAKGMNPGETFRDGDLYPEMAVIPHGKFTMGSNEFLNESPSHQVTIRRAFAVGKFAVTFDEWDACAKAGGCSGYRPDDGGWGRGTRPVINVSWEDANDYVRWLSARTRRRYRLLREAEWEYAARAGTLTNFPWGDSIGKGNANGAHSGSPWRGRQTAPVGSFPPNPWGLCDMHGNVWEWVEDPYHSNYTGAPADESLWVGDGSSSRVVRGGSWSANANFLRSAHRSKMPLDFRGNSSGFRVAVTILIPSP